MSMAGSNAYIGAVMARPGSANSRSSRPTSAARVPLKLQPTHGMCVRVPGSSSEVRPVTVLPSIGALTNDGVGEGWQSPVIVPQRVGDPGGLFLGHTNPQFNHKVRRVFEQ